MACTVWDINVSDEPLIHDFETDCLPEAHPLAHETVHCGRCKRMVHAFNNECMSPWIEWCGKVLCLDCGGRALIDSDWRTFERLAGELVTT